MRFLSIALASFLLLAGCSQHSRLMSPISSPLGLGGDGSQSAGDGLVSIAHSSGSLWPITVVSGLFLLAAIPAFFILSKRQFFILLAVGVVLAISPIILLRVMDHLIIPFAVLIGLGGAAALAFFLGRLWDRRLIRKRAACEAAKLVSPDTPTRISDKDAAGIVTRLTEK